MGKNPKARHQNYSNLEIHGYEKVIKDLEKKLEVRVSTPPLLPHPLPGRNLPNMNFYAEELKQQIEAKKLRKEIEEKEKTKPHISIEFSGYPNIPQTPRNIRRQREIEKMRKVRNDLNSQLLEKMNAKNASKSLENEMEKKLKEDDLTKMREENINKARKKMRDKDILLKSWNLAQKTKKLQEALDCPSNNTSRLRGDDTIENEGALSNSTDNKKLNLEGVLGLPSYKRKAKEIKEKLDSQVKKSYQYKIKQIVEQAKKIRASQNLPAVSYPFS